MGQCEDNSKRLDEGIMPKLSHVEGEIGQYRESITRKIEKLAGICEECRTSEKDEELVTNELQDQVINYKATNMSIIRVFVVNYLVRLRLIMVQHDVNVLRNCIIIYITQ
jgi:hypothetical protein